MFAKDEKEKAINEIYELFLKTPGLPIPESEHVLINAVKEGVKNGIVGLKKGERIYYKQDVEPTMDSIVLRREVAEEILREIEAKEKTEERVEQKWEKAETRVEEKEKVKPVEPERIGEKKKVKRVLLEAEVSWDKLSPIISGVLSPLKDKGSLKVVIKVDAESKEGFDELTLNSKVRETLKQINAKILSWVEE